MKIYEPSQIRTFALVGHGGAGKTSIADAIAFLTGLNNRLGSVSDKTSLMDFEVEEQNREGSISTSFLTCEHDGYKVHLADTPGDGNFAHDGQVCLQAFDTAVLVVSAVDGVQVVTEKMKSVADEQGRPLAVVINKIDRERADYKAVMGELSEVLGMTPALLQLPIGKEEGFKGVVDLLSKKAYTYAGDDGKATVGPVPDDMADEVESALEELIEAIAMVDDALVEKYLEDGELSEDEIRSGLSEAIVTGVVTPVVLTCATKNIGTDRLLWLSRYFPSPLERPLPSAFEPGNPGNPVELAAGVDAPLAALCFKTVIDPFVGQLSVMRIFAGTATGETSALNIRTDKNERFGQLLHLVGKKTSGVDKGVPGDIIAVPKLKETHTGDTLTSAKKGPELTFIQPPKPMTSYVIKPRSRADEDKVRGALNRILAEDPGLIQSFDDVTKEIVLSGMGDNHVALSMEKMTRKYGVNVDLGTPTVPYRETISGSADVRYRHKKQTGGAGQFGEVAIRIERAEGEGFVFENKVVGGVIPSSLIPSVEKGVRQQLDEGVLAGFPVIDMRVTLYDGKSHPVDSKDIAFQIAGRQAIKQAVAQARPILLEPIYKVEVTAPEANVGDVMGDMNTRRARVQGMEGRGRNSVVTAFVPLAEMLSYSPTLKSMTGGQGSYTMEFSSYEPVPYSSQEKLVAEVSRLRHDES